MAGFNPPHFAEVVFLGLIFEKRCNQMDKKVKSNSVILFATKLFVF